MKRRVARCRVRGRGLRCAPPPQELPCLAAPVCTHSRASRWDPDTSTAEGPLRAFNGFAQGPAQVRGSQARVNCTWNLPFPCWSPAPSGAWGGPLARPRPAGWGPAAPGSESTCSSDQALSPFTFQSRGGATSRRPRATQTVSGGGPGASSSRAAPATSWGDSSPARWSLCCTELSGETLEQVVKAAAGPHPPPHSHLLRQAPHGQKHLLGQTRLLGGRAESRPRPRSWARTAHTGCFWTRWDRE